MNKPINSKALIMIPDYLTLINANYRTESKRKVLGAGAIKVLYCLIDKCIHSNSLEFILTPAEWQLLNEGREDGGPSQVYRDLDRVTKDMSSLSAEHPFGQLGLFPDTRVPVFDRIQYTDAVIRGKFMPWTGLANFLEP